MNEGSVKYNAEKRRWEIRVDPDLRIRLKRIFAQQRSTSEKTILLSDTLDAARDIVWILDRYELKVSAADRTRLEEGAAAHRARDRLVEHLFRGEQQSMAFELAEPPYYFQKEAAEICYRMRSLLVADDLGVGKTVSGICLLSLADTRPAVVVVPPALAAQWERNMKRFAPNLVTHVVKHGKVYDLEYPRGIGDFVFPDVIIMGVTKLVKWIAYLMQTKFLKTVVYEEIQSFRHEDTKKYNAAEHISEMCTWRMGLSATPIHNYGGEFFPVMQLLSPGCLGEKEEFLKEHTHGADSRGRAKFTEPEAFGAMLRKRGLMIRRSRKDVGQVLPPCTRVFQEVPYDSKKLDEVAAPAMELAKIIIALTESRRGERMQASGRFDMLLRQATGIAKAVGVAEFVKILLDSEEKILLFGYHRAVYDVWLEKLKEFKPVMFTGSENTREKDENQQAFMKGDSRVLIMSIRAGVGLDGLQEICRTMVFGEFDWSPQIHKQNEGRLDRPGQDEPVYAYYCHALEGSDPDIISLLREKSEELAPVLGREAEVFAGSGDHRHHIRRLAERYLEKMRKNRVA